VAPFYEVPVEEWAVYQQMALEKLHVRMTGITHQLLLWIYEEIKVVLSNPRYYDEKKRLTVLGNRFAVDKAGSAWLLAFAQWRVTFERARREAAEIGLATLARLHVEAFGVEELDERRGQSVGQFIEQFGGTLPFAGALPWMAEVEDVLRELENHVYSDGFTLSGRIWRLEQGGRAAIQQVIVNGFSRGLTVYEIAAELENHLGASSRCPRWTEARMALTPAEIAAGDPTGLVKGEVCGSEGVAYNALRLARNEIQLAHQAALRRIFAAIPWVIGERLYLHDLHPPDIDCECEEIVGWPNSRVSEVLPVGSVSLPLHILCMCFLLPELMTREEFEERFRRWQLGEEPWPEMDQYSQQMGLVLEPIPTVPPPEPDAGFIPSDRGSWWWLLLIMLALAYERWQSKDKEPKDEALSFEAGDW